MDINEHFQKLHTVNGNNQWIEKQKLEKDILLLFHQLSSYSYLMGDLYYSELYSLPYWKYIDNNYWQIDINEEDKQFIEIGCLVMIATMAMEIIDEAGSFILKTLDAIEASMSSYNPMNQKLHNLKKMVMKLLLHAKSGEITNRDIIDISINIHKEYVRDYYKKKVFEFEHNDHFK